MNQQLVPYQPQAIARSYSVAEKLEYCTKLAQADLLPKAYYQKPGNVLLAIEYGESLGLTTVQAIQQVHVIEGKVSASSGLISALVRRAGHKLRLSGDNTKATCTITRSDDPEPFTVTWTIEDARRAGLADKGTWAKYPAAMLKARALTACARDACQEALSGVCYTPEELGAHVNVDGEPVAAAVVTVTPQERAQAIQAEIVEPSRLQALREEVTALTRQHFTSREEVGLWIGKHKLDLKTEAGCVEALRLLREPASEDDKARAMRHFWASATEAGLSEEEAKFACARHALLTNNEAGNPSCNASTVEQLDSSALWFKACDAKAVAAEYAAECAAAGDVDF